MNGINKKIQQLKKMSLYRDIKYLSEAQYKYTTIDNKPVMLMASNNYLGLSNNNLIKKAVIESIKYYGVGSGGSRLTTGSYNVHRKLEKKIAKFKNCEDCLIFNNGYMANVGVISSICDEEFTIFSDELNHASIIDGWRYTPIVPIIIGNEDVTNEFSKKFLEEGVFIPAIRYPTVKKGEARLRATLMVTHSFDDIDFAIEKIKKVNEFIKINTIK